MASQTSSFGVSARIGHDSSVFYNSKLYENLDVKQNKKKKKENENPILEKYINQIFAHSSEKMSELPDNSVHLMVTSPPYNVSKDYDENLSLNEYLALLKRVLKETKRVLVNGGRVCVNIANVGRKPYIPLTMYVNQIMLDLGFF